MLSKRILVFCCCLASLSMFSQEKTSEHEEVQLPASIYTSVVKDVFKDVQWYSYNNLKLTDFKFFITPNNFVYTGSVADLRNIGRTITIEDLQDNYQKKELNKYFFTGYDLRAIPWRAN